MTLRPLAPIGFILLLALGAVILWPGVHGPFLFDDIPNFQNLEHLNGRLNRHSIGVYLSLFGGAPGRPLSALSFLLNDFAWPSDALGFKTTNLLIHLLNGCLAFGLARSLACAQQWPRANAVALLTSAIWLVNPIQVSAIFLTVQRMTLLSGLFVLVGLWAYVAMARRATGIAHAYTAVLALGAGTLLAVLSKENGALAVLYAAALNATLLRPQLAAMPTRVRLPLIGAPLLAFGLLCIAIASQWQKFANYDIRPFSLYERVLTEGRVMLTYVWHILAPKLSSSSLYNDDFPISTGLLSPSTTLLSLLVIASALAAAWKVRTRAPLFSFAVLWFLSGHAMESTVLSLELYFEHRNYVPLFGIALALSAGTLQLKGKLAKPLLACLLAWLAMCASISHLQARVWGNWAMLSTIWRAENPTSLRAQQQYADFLYRTGRIADARQVFADNIARGLAVGDSRLQIAVIDCRDGRELAPVDLRQIEEYLHSGELNIGSIATLSTFRESIRSGECPTSMSAARWLTLTELALANPSAIGSRRVLRMERAYLLVDAGRLELAEREWQRAWEVDNEPRIAFYAAAVLASNGRFDRARVWASRPLKQPGSRWNAWLAQTDQQARELLRAIDESQAAARHQRRSEAGGNTP